MGPQRLQAAALFAQIQTDIPHFTVPRGCIQASNKPGEILDLPRMETSQMFEEGRFGFRAIPGTLILLGSRHGAFLLVTLFFRIIAHLFISRWCTRAGSGTPKRVAQVAGGGRARTQPKKSCGAVTEPCAPVELVPPPSPPGPVRCWWRGSLRVGAFEKTVRHGANGRTRRAR